MKHAEELRKKNSLTRGRECRKRFRWLRLMPRQYNRLLEAGVDETLGDHTTAAANVPVLETSKRMVKPANDPGDATGRT